MICSDTVEQRETALAKLLPMQQGDFEALRGAGGLPRYHPFPGSPAARVRSHRGGGHRAAGQGTGQDRGRHQGIIASLHEFNPMMGHRGCRLAVTYPEIAVMQTSAVIRAAINVQKKHPDWNMMPEIMIPLVGEVKELKFVKDVVVKTADEEHRSSRREHEVRGGHHDRDPARRSDRRRDRQRGRVLLLRHQRPDPDDLRLQPRRRRQVPDAYYDNKIYEIDPFARLDQVGVGKLMKMAAKLGRRTRPDIHWVSAASTAAIPSSVEFCHKWD